MSSPETATTREITFGKAINEALAEELRRDERVFVIGEDVAEAGTPFKVLSGLVDEFGTDRVIDSPISEAGVTGLPASPRPPARFRIPPPCGSARTRTAATGTWELWTRSPSPLADAGLRYGAAGGRSEIG